MRATGVPTITLPARPPPTAEEIAQIKQHIANLALIDTPDMGLSSTYGGSAFAPVPQSAQVGALIFGATSHKTPDDFLQLVKLGPKALPYLLAALDDQTPTKLVLGAPIPGSNGFRMGGVYEANEIVGNPANPAEEAALGPRPAKDPAHFDLGKGIDQHTVTVGDVCFVIIGQITGRPSYHASRYQMTAITIITSPTDDPALVKQVRAVWTAADPAQHLLDSLLIDFFTTVESTSKTPIAMLGDVSAAMGYPDLAAMRLLYYFPSETSGLIMKRLAERPGDQRLLQAIAWSDQPDVRQYLLKLFRETTDPAVFLTCLPQVEAKDDDLVLRRIFALLDSYEPLDGGGPYDDGAHLVFVAGRRFGAASKPVYVHYLEKPTVNRVVAICDAVSLHPEWTVELLAPYLEDQRMTKLWYGRQNDRIAFRLCDWVAQAISKYRPDLPFVAEGTYDDLDRQITAMKELIAKGSLAAPVPAAK